MSLKNPVTPPGIRPGTVGLVAQRLNHYATPGPVTKLWVTQNGGEFHDQLIIWQVDKYSAKILIALCNKKNLVSR